jgi:hypothetical protein
VLIAFKRRENGILLLKIGNNLLNRRRLLALRDVARAEQISPDDQQKVGGVRRAILRNFNQIDQLGIVGEMDGHGLVEESYLADHVVDAMETE